MGGLGVWLLGGRKGINWRVTQLRTSLHIQAFPACLFQGRGGFKALTDHGAPATLDDLSSREKWHAPNLEFEF